MRNSLLVASLGVATSLAVACSSAGVDTLLDGTGTKNAFADGGAAAPGTDPGNGGGGGGSGGGNDAGGTNSGNGNDAGGNVGPQDGGTPPPPPPPGAGIPCDVSAVLAAKCIACHSDPPINGSLSGLVTIGDLMATSKEDPTKNEAQLSLQRMQGTPSPMPPTSFNHPATAADIAAFQSWINASYRGSCADAGPPPPPVDVFTNAPAYVSTVAVNTHNAGQNCMGGCHDHGFTFAGTLTDGQGHAIAGAEVRLVDKNGLAISVHTGSDGNFHSSTPFVMPAHVGARNAANKAIMVTALTTASNGGCNGCHRTGGTVVPIHLP